MVARYRVIVNGATPPYPGGTRYGDGTPTLVTCHSTRILTIYFQLSRTNKIQISPFILPNPDKIAITP